jgi:hypothetical protein
MPTAAGPAVTRAGEVARADVTKAAFPPVAQPLVQPFVPGPSAEHVLVAPPGAVKKPAARLKPVASAAVPPAPKTTAARTATKPVAQPRAVKPPLEQMMDDLFRTLSNGQPPNPTLQPESPGTRR